MRRTLNGMARTAFTVTAPDRDGETVTPQSADATNGNAFPWTGSELLVIENGDTGEHTASVAVAATPDGNPVDPKAIVVAAGSTVVAGPFPQLYRQSADGMVYVDWDADTSVTVIPILAP